MRLKDIDDEIYRLSVYRLMLDSKGEAGEAAVLGRRLDDLREQLDQTLVMEKLESNL